MARPTKSWSSPRIKKNSGPKLLGHGVLKTTYARTKGPTSEARACESIKKEAKDQEAMELIRVSRREIFLDAVFL